MLRDVGHNFDALVPLNYPHFPTLHLEQRRALRWLFEFCQANEDGSLPRKARLNGQHSFLDLLGDQEDYPPPIGPAADSREDP